MKSLQKPAFHLFLLIILFCGHSSSATTADTNQDLETAQAAPSDEVRWIRYSMMDFIVSFCADLNEQELEVQLEYVKELNLKGIVIEVSHEGSGWEPLWAFGIQQEERGINFLAESIYLPYDTGKCKLKLVGFLASGLKVESRPYQLP